MAKLSCKQALKKIGKAQEKLSRVKLNPNPQIAKVELQALGLAARVKKEGING